MKKGGNFINTKNWRVNENIKASEVRVIDENKKNLGVMPLKEALKLARERNLDLVEVVPQASPPVCYIVDYGKFKYEQQQKEKELKRKQQSSVLKEIRLSPKINEHDYQTKLNQIKEFLEAKQRVRITIMMRGRESIHKDLALNLKERIIKDIEEFGYLEGKPKFLGEGGNIIQLTFLPGKKIIKEEKKDEIENP
ncbi:MAG: translation initiation factor IF-3 [candidate division WOR-3 bacterium]|nr:translation initiation factor IF-3 [candidate division WOR-3 bacterium]MCX7837037.1 translation initiation factor IF-3 [candidate division WOR-3 bacterium]MDW8114394.1 translation initiation factor IF-3 [candidate division WOR-3 bacterium]